MKLGGNVEAAKQVGLLLAERAKAIPVNAVVFDRGGRLYHGRVKSLADAARSGGLVCFSLSMASELSRVLLLMVSKRAERGV